MEKRRNVGRARCLRRDATEVEARLWRALRSRQLEGAKFRRQFPIGPYIVDFVCLAAKLVVEADGGQHAERFAYDAERSRHLEAQGFRVLRFWNHQIIEEEASVIEAIRLALGHPHPSPLPPAGEGAEASTHEPTCC